MYGSNNRLLRVNLTSRNIRIESLDEGVYRTYLGGRGLALFFLLRELAPQVDPLGPENILVFATGVATGAPLAGFSRFSVAGKSPLTGGFGESEAGGFWGPELKRAGFDAIIIEGSSAKPVYLSIKDGQAEIRNAAHVWGKTTKDTQEAIREEIGDEKVRIVSIGQAGEKLCRFACIMNELRFANGRNGFGAVMGSKKLKAIAARGRQKVEWKDPEKIRELAKWFSENWKKHAPTFSRSVFGTSELVASLNADGTLPTCNFKKGVLEGAEEISGEKLKNTLFTGSEGCYACPVRCKKAIRGIKPYTTDPSYGGPEYETIAAFGSLCGVNDISTIALANQLCNAYGMDTISTGAAIAFAMECYENGVFTVDKTEGLELRFGNADATVRLVEMIAKRKGLGAVLAEGVRRASERLGKGSGKFAIHVKGKEIPMHEPRGKVGLALQYALSPSGADHMQAAHDAYFERNVEEFKPLGISQTVDRLSLGPEKVRLFRQLNLWWSLLDCLCVCKFMFTTHPAGIFKTNHLVEIVNAATGWDTDLSELLVCAERSVNMARIFNLREGFTNIDDWLPERFFEPLQGGPREGAKISKSDLKKAIGMYYKMMSWDGKTGVPTLAKLAELGLAAMSI